MEANYYRLCIAPRQVKFLKSLRKPWSADVQYTYNTYATTWYSYGAGPWSHYTLDKAKEKGLKRLVKALNKVERRLAQESEQMYFYAEKDESGEWVLVSKKR